MSILLNNSNENSIVRRKDSFTFENQRKKFSYINSVGDIVEKNIPHFRDIWPFLGAYTNGKEAWHSNLNEYLEMIGIAHYTVLKSLCYIQNNKDHIDTNDQHQRFKNIIFHYSIINEVILSIHAYIIQFRKRLKDLSGDISQEILVRATKDKTKKNAEKKLKELYNNDYKYIEGFLEFRAESQPIRNLFAHYPTIDLFYRIEDGKKEKLMVKPDFIKKIKP